MKEWWNGMHEFQQVLFVIACAMTLFMIVQIILLAVGSGDHDGSFDADTDTDGADTVNDDGTGLAVFGLKILSVRSIIAFFALGSWTTLALFYVIDWFALIPGVAVGLAAAFAIAYFMKMVYKLQSSGNLDLANAVGKMGEVYLTVPACRKGNGKVNLYVQERYVELEAVTDCATPIKTGAKVKIVQSVNEGLVLVAPFDTVSSETDVSVQ